MQICEVFSILPVRRWLLVVWRDFPGANLFHVNLKFRIKSILMGIIMIFQTLMITHTFVKQIRELIFLNS